MMKTRMERNYFTPLALPFITRRSTYRSVSQVFDSAIEVGCLADEPCEVIGHGGVEVWSCARGRQFLQKVRAKLS